MVLPGNLEAVHLDREFVRAVSKVRVRAEDQVSIASTFEDPGTILALSNANSQVIFGRRGTGKTHLFRYLSHSLAQPGEMTLYIDALTLGSSTDIRSNRGVDAGDGALWIFRDLLARVHDRVLDHSIDIAAASEDAVLELCEQMLECIYSRTRTIDTEEVSRTESESHLGIGTVDLGIGTASSSAGYGSHKETSEALERTTASVGKISEAVDFAGLSVTMDRLLEAVGGSRLYILIDEWQEIPPDVQPVLAEYLKRSFRASKNVTLKIAAVRHRAQFLEGRAPRSFGLELGADIATTQDLDDYYLLDRARGEVLAQYLSVLHRHLSASAYPGVRVSSNAAQFESDIFEDGAFGELAAAAGGVVRDLIAVFGHAVGAWHRDASSRRRHRIDQQLVRRAAADWFERDKLGVLDQATRDVVSVVEDAVLTRMGSRFFVVPADGPGPGLLAGLVDARVIHRLYPAHRFQGYPGRYSVYTLDYGSYVTALAPARGVGSTQLGDPQSKSVMRSLEEITDPTTVTLDDRVLERLRMR